jgi:phosphoadenosine phosphosulfate reductase
MNAKFQQAMVNLKEYGYNSNPFELLEWAIKQFGFTKIVMGTGFGAPGVVLLDIVKQINKDIDVFYIDTGILFPETYRLKKQLEDKYDMKFMKFNTQISLHQQSELYGNKLWNENPDLCCNVRKVMPLKKALTNYEVWVTGIRRAQTKLRVNSNSVEYDERYNITKINPLVSWTHNQVWEYIRNNNLPYNELHDKNYPSLGCTHCTSSVKPGEDHRSGRWRGSCKTECGLHFKQENNQIKIVKSRKNIQ